MPIRITSADAKKAGPVVSPEKKIGEHTRIERDTEFYYLLRMHTYTLIEDAFMELMKANKELTNKHLEDLMEIVKRRI